MKESNKMQCSIGDIVKAVNGRIEMSDLIHLAYQYIEKDCAGYPFRFVKEFENRFNELLNEEYGDGRIRIQIVHPGDDEK